MEEHASAQETAKRRQDSAQRSMQEAMRARLENARRQETGTPRPETARPSTQESVRIADEPRALELDTSSLCAHINHEICRSVIGLASTTLSANAHLATELQQIGLQACSEVQAASVRWTALWSEVFHDPLGVSLRALDEGMETARQSLHVAWQSSNVVTRWLQQMQRSVEEASHSVQKAFKAGASKV